MPYETANRGHSLEVRIMKGKVPMNQQLNVVNGHVVLQRRQKNCGGLVKMILWNSDAKGNRCRRLRSGRGLIRWKSVTVHEEYT